MPPFRHEHVRVYEALRTAHLERFHALEPASVLYVTRNYDFDPALLDGLDVHQVPSRRAVFLRLLRSDVRTLEINEPLMLSAVGIGLAAITATRLRGLITRRPTRVVSYAIGNDDPFAGQQARLRTPWRRLAYRLATAYLLRHVDRLAVGTPGALDVYRPLTDDRSEVRLMEALPAPCDCVAPSAEDGRSGVVFLGAFDERKGLRQLLAAWPTVSPGGEVPLRLLGKGELVDLAQTAATRLSGVTVQVDPTRADIHQALGSARVLVLLSQASPTWREQVGLPIVEGLAHGCEIVATTQTGLATWLSDHDHQVVAAPSSEADIAAAIVRALSSTRTATEVRQDLPASDGRLSADRWMFAPSACERIFLHSSDELYGADRVLLDLIGALDPSERARTEVWLPTDLPHGERPLCVELERRGVRVRHEDLPILRRAYGTPAGLWSSVGRCRHLVRRLRETAPDLVYCTTSATFPAAQAARLAGVRRVVGHVQEIWSPSDARILGPFARSCDRLLAISGPVAASLPAVLGPRTSVVLNATPAPAHREPLDSRDGPLTFLVASRWNSWKGHGTLFAAWQAAGCPGRLVVLGGPPPSGAVTDVHALRSALTEPETVEIVGEVPDIAPHLRAADVVIMPSDRPEPFGLVAIEAFANGRAVIASDSGGLRDIVTDGADGWLFPCEDVAALAKLLGGLDRARVNAAGQRAEATYRRNYTSDEYAVRWRAAVGLPVPPAPEECP